MFLYDFALALQGPSSIAGLGLMSSAGPEPGERVFCRGWDQHVFPTTRLHRWDSP